MIAFSLDEDQTLMQQGTALLARRLREGMRAAEKARDLPADVRKAAHEMGLGAVPLPEAVGGAGLGMTTAVLLEEEIAAGDPAAAFALGGAGFFGLAVAELGSEGQAKDLLAPLVAEGGWDKGGAVAWSERKPRSDKAGFSTRAVAQKGGWRLDGEKSFVLGAGRADRFVVFAQVDEDAGWDGLGAFVVERGATGVGVGDRVTTLGLDVAHAGSLRLEGVKLDTTARLARFENVFRFFAKAALVVAAREVGLARSAFEAAREYCEVRKAFGKPIGHFQAVAFTLADRAMDVEAARALVWRAASAWDAADAASSRDPKAEKAALLHTAWAVSFCHEAAMRCGDDAVQLHGGSGFMRDYPVEKFMRDAKQMQLAVMTAEQADQLAAAIELEIEPSVAAILPTPESQSTFT